MEKGNGKTPRPRTTKGVNDGRKTRNKRTARPGTDNRGSSRYAAAFFDRCAKKEAKDNDRNKAEARSAKTSSDFYPSTQNHRKT